MLAMSSRGSVGQKFEQTQKSAAVATGSSINCVTVYALQKCSGVDRVLRSGNVVILTCCFHCLNRS